MLRKSPAPLLALSLLLSLSGCIDQERWLFEVRPDTQQDMSSADASCTPKLCSPSQCGVFEDGCGGVIDCGPCSSARCPAKFEVLFSDVLNPNMLHHDPASDTLFFVNKNGSNPIAEWFVGQEPTIVNLTDGSSTAGFVPTADYVYYFNSKLQRLRRRDRPELPYRVEVTLPRVAALVRHNEQLWATTQEPPALWVINTPSTQATQLRSLAQAPVRNFLSSTSERLAWVTRANGQEQVVTFPLDNSADPQTEWQTPGKIVELIATSNTLSWLAKEEQTLSLWSMAPNAPPTLITQWDDVEPLDLKPLDEGRVLLARALGASFRQGWHVSTVSLLNGAESVIFSVDNGVGFTPALEPLATDGQCAFIAYQYQFRVQRSERGDIGWVRIDSPPPR